MSTGEMHRFSSIRYSDLLCLSRSTCFICKCYRLYKNNQSINSCRVVFICQTILTAVLSCIQLSIIQPYQGIFLSRRLTWSVRGIQRERRLPQWNRTSFSSSRDTSTRAVHFTEAQQRVGHWPNVTAAQAGPRLSTPWRSGTLASLCSVLV